MTDPSPPPDSIDAVLAWTEEGAPRSAHFDDIYFQPGEGLGEARTVFLEGCGLPEAWAGRRRFVVGELGFGTGLNIFALLDLWRRARGPGQRLEVFSVEAFPLSRDDAARALAAWPELADLAQGLLAVWPRQAQGFHRLDLPDLNATIDLAIGDVAWALRAWTGRADAWFLDGFSPTKNPRMWDEEVMGLIAERTAPGARLGTFTVAGHVRRGLAAHGFAVSKQPGHGRKRQRLEARWPGEAQDLPPSSSLVIVGAGIAGAAVARAARAQGLPVTVIAGAPAASANPAALVTPMFDVGEGVSGRLHAQAFARAVDLYLAEGPRAVIAQGVLRLERDGRDDRRFAALERSRLFAPDALARLGVADACAWLGETTPVGAGLLIRDGLVVEPGAVTAAWLEGSQRIAAVAAAVQPIAGGWRVLGEDGAILAEAAVVCLAAGPANRALAGLPLGMIRGQANWVEGVDGGRPATWGGYAVPTRSGVLFGATHDRGDEGVESREADTARNVQTLRRKRPAVAALLGEKTLEGRAALRVTSADRLPVAGALGNGMFVLGALGGRGFATAPLLAEHVVALATGAASPLPGDLAEAVDPSRLAG